MTASSSESIPSPALVSAWEALGTLRAESVPMWAAHWVANGLDGEGVVALACLEAGDVREVHDLLPHALRDAGIEPMTELAAAVRLAFDDIAKLCLSGKASWRWVIAAVAGVCEQNGYASVLFDEPLGAVHGLDDELTGRWGRQATEIERAVREACERQALLTD